MQACSAGQYSVNRGLEPRPSVRADIRACIRRAKPARFYLFFWFFASNVGFQILLLLRDSQPLREVQRIRLGRKARSVLFTPILASAYFTRSLRVYVISRAFY